MACKREFRDGPLEVEEGRGNALDVALVSAYEPNLPRSEAVASTVGGGMLSRRETFSRNATHEGQPEGGFFDEENFPREHRRRTSWVDYENLPRGHTTPATVVCSLITAAIGSGICALYFWFGKIKLY